MLARHAATENNTNNNNEEDGETGSGESEGEVLPRKRRRVGPKERRGHEKSPRVSLRDMIEKTAAEVASNAVSDSISQ